MMSTFVFLQDIFIWYAPLFSIYLIIIQLLRIVYLLFIIIDKRMNTNNHQHIHINISMHRHLLTPVRSPLHEHIYEHSFTTSLTRTHCGRRDAGAPEGRTDVIVKMSVNRIAVKVFVNVMSS